MRCEGTMKANRETPIYTEWFYREKGGGGQSFKHNLGTRHLVGFGGNWPPHKKNTLKTITMGIGFSNLEEFSNHATPVSTLP